MNETRPDFDCTPGTGQIPLLAGGCPMSPEALADLNARYDAAPDQRGALRLGWNPRNFPIPRVRFGWDGPKFMWLAVEVADDYSDPVVGVTWELPSWLSVRVDSVLRKVCK